jgi:hypothetical protein
MVQYSNKLIFGVMEDNPLLAYFNIANVSDVEGFNQVLRPLLDTLRNNAASGSSTRKFAVGSAATPDFQTIRALLMCTPNLDELECSNFLRRAVGSLQKSQHFDACLQYPLRTRYCRHASNLTRVSNDTCQIVQP